MYKVLPNIIIEISEDGLVGYISIIENSQEEQPDEILNVDQIVDKVKEIIKYGLDEKRLRELLTSNSKVYKETIARGVMPINGEDGYIKYYFDIEKEIKPQILEDGTVDYKELDAINTVTAGEVLAELIPPREGKDGIKVTGDIIPYKKGKSPLLKYGKNVRLLNNDKTLVAEKDGLVALKGDKVIVLDVLRVDNVDNTIGNIRFDGSVMVRENVLSGFKVIANGDVQVNGVVEGGYIENTGDVIIKQGIQGYNRLTVQTKGNLSTKFIENSVIKADKDITAESIMHSQVSCKQNLTLVGKKGLIVGGICRAGKEIKAKTVGSLMSTNTILEVGIDPETKEKYIATVEQMKACQYDLDKIEKMVTFLEKMKKSNRLDKEKMLVYAKLLKTRESLMNKYDELKDIYLRLKDEVKDTSQGRIIVTDIVYPGVKLVIGNCSMVVRNEIRNSMFYVEDGEIRIAPYWE